MEPFHNPNAILVTTMHVLRTGEIIQSLEAFEKVQERFSWVDRTSIIQRVMKLRAITDSGKRSVIVFYEDGQLVKEHLNVEDNFIPLVKYVI